MSFATKEQVQEIVEHIGDNLHLPQLIQHFDKGNIYSTEERLIGQWCDGKPLYKRTVTVTFPSVSNGDYSIAKVSVSNIDTVINIEQNYISNTGTNIATNPWFTNSGMASKSYFSRETQEICLSTNNSGLTGTLCYITFYYTKTTDTALDYTIGTENDYSTDERLIGTWIDGKPVYQKTFSKVISAPVDNIGNSNVIDITSLNVENVLDIRGFVIADTINVMLNSAWLSSDNSTVYVSYAYRNANNLCIVPSRTSWDGRTVYITIQYTKVV